ncbi:Panacea domain-containing protein, partial [Peptococcus simiae]|uniref:Panacea domain-containing protein n=1 Tax=Peptococcus simiae TaxID=1643805 RepID=UPI00397F1C40
PSLYPYFADYRWNEIPRIESDEGSFTEEELDVLEAVYLTYGGFTGDQLESLTHSEDPWIIARGELKPWETSREVISHASMREYYSKKYEEAQND